MEKISGSIKKVIYYKEENGYTVASLIVTEDASLEVINRNPSLKNEIVVVGIMSRIPIEEEYYEFTGDFIQNKNYGFQFGFKKVERKSINSKFGLIHYLSSDLFPGIGEKTATLIVDTLGIKTIELIKKDPFVLDQIKLSPNQKAAIIAGIINDEEVQDTTIFLLDNGLSLDMANKIISALRENNITKLIEKIKDNPYELINLVERFGFKKADLLAKNIGFNLYDPRRIKALLIYTLKEVLNSYGDSYINFDDFYLAICNEVESEEIDKELFTQYVDECHMDKSLFYDRIENVVFEYRSYINELELAKQLATMLKSDLVEHFTTKQIDDAFNAVQDEFKINYNEEQLEAIKKSFTEPIVIITGGPGTGKTTIIHAILQMYMKLNNNNNLLLDRIALVAPTGRAARRLNESTNMPAQTIHKFLGYNGKGFEFNRFHKTTAKLIIVDEASMMDLSLASNLICSMANDARIILVGDVDQLPSVGPGQVLKDLIDSKEISTIRLNKIHRQSVGSTIVTLAHDINEGILPPDILEKKDDRAFIKCSYEVLPQSIIDVYQKALKSGIELKDLEVLIPMYNIGCGINVINSKLQDIVNPESDLPEYKTELRRFRVKDKVIQLVNRTDKNIMNGDIGYIESFQFKNDGKTISSLTVKYDTVKVDYAINELDDISLAYAISIHKSQGSEFKTVIIPFDPRHFRMLKKRLIYTAITRAKDKLILLGDIDTFRKGIGLIEQERKTILKDRFKEFINKTTSSGIKEFLKQLDEKEERSKKIDLENKLGEEEVKLEDF